MATALVTGSSRGIGLALCAALAGRGDDVIAVCRTPTPELEALGVRVVDGIDVATDEGVSGLAAVEDDLDIVLSVAGISTPMGGIDEAETPQMLREYDVNALGALRVVRAVLPRVREGGKIGLMTTGTGSSFAHTTPTVVNYGYRMSKAALNVFGAILAHELRPRGISVVLLAPGPVDTDMLREAISTGHMTRAIDSVVSPDEAAVGLLQRLDELGPETSGRWIERTGIEYT